MAGPAADGEGGRGEEEEGEGQQVCHHPGYQQPFSIPGWQLSVTLTLIPLTGMSCKTQTAESICYGGDSFRRWGFAKLLSFSTCWAGEKYTSTSKICFGVARRYKDRLAVIHSTCFPPADPCNPTTYERPEEDGHWKPENCED